MEKDKEVRRKTDGPVPYPKTKQNKEFCTLSVSSALMDFMTPWAGLSWMWARFWGTLWEADIGGNGARLFLGASDGKVLEMYVLEMVLDLVKVGRLLLTRGVAGALAV